MRARPIGRRFLFMRVGDFDVLAEDFGVSNIEIRNVRFVRQPRLILRQPLLGIRADVAKSIEFCVESRCNDPTLAKVRCGIGKNRAAEILRLFVAKCALRD